MRDKSILEKLKAFPEFDGAVMNRYPTRDGLLKFIQAGGVTVSWYNRGKIGVQIEKTCGMEANSYCPNQPHSTRSQ
jgi:hypothetical protein